MVVNYLEFYVCGGCFGFFIIRWFLKVGVLVFSFLLVKVKIVKFFEGYYYLGNKDNVDYLNKIRIVLGF